MRNLTSAELMDIAGGELNCSVGIPSGVSCSGTLSDWKQAYEGLVNAVTDAMCAATGKC